MLKYASHITRILPLVATLRSSSRRDLRGDLAAGLTVGAMLVPQAMAYALLAGLPPEVGLYASTIPVIAYALFGTSRQLAVGPVAIVSLLTATALAPLVEEGTASYLEAAALLALMVGVVHLVLGFGRLGFLVNFLSHSVLVGFTAAAAIIIGFSQAKHIFGISVARQEHFYETVAEVFAGLGDTNATTMILGLAAVSVLVALKRFVPRAPGALVVVVGSTLAVSLLDLESRGVKVVGDVPDSLPVFAIPSLDGSLIGSMLPTALVITLVGFMESIAVAKVYARRNNYEVDANQELISLGMANSTAGLFGGYPVTGGFSRTAVNATAGARTPLASLVTAAVVLLTIVLLTPLFVSLPNSALGAIIIVAVAGLVDISEMRHIARVKRSDLVGLSVAFVATLAIGIELGILVAVVASMLVVFARMSKPHTAVLGRLAGTTTFRNIDRFPDAVQVPGVRIVRIDAAVSFANATYVKRLLLDQADAIDSDAPSLVLDASGINDIDATGAAALVEVLQSFEDRDVTLHLAAVKGPVRDVLQRAAIWDRLVGRIHVSIEEAMAAIQESGPPEHSNQVDTRPNEVDEYRRSETSPTPGAVDHG
jgi:SulP family sulfate permease